MDETQAAYPELRYDLRFGWVADGSGEPEGGIRQPTLWGFTQPADGGSDPTCDRPGHRYSYCDCGPFEAEAAEPDDATHNPDDWAHGDTCDCADCDGGAWADSFWNSWDDDGAIYDPGHPGQLNDSP